MNNLGVNQSSWLRPFPVVFLFLFFWLTACGLVQEEIPPPVTTAPPASAYETLTAVTTTTIPPRDMPDLIARFQGGEVARVAQTSPTPYQVGDRDNFWYKDVDNGENKQIQAELAYRSDHLNLWFEEGINPKAEDVTAVAARLENDIIPTNRAFFGVEWQPGVDGDNRLNILHLKDVGNIGVAYFWSGDEHTTAVNPYLQPARTALRQPQRRKLGSDLYFKAIAHESQHLIQWHHGQKRRRLAE
jgi:immune inhibitor A